MVNREVIRKLCKDQHLAVVLAGGFGGVAITRELGRLGIPTIVLGLQSFVTKSKYCLGIHIVDAGEILDFLTQLPECVNKKPVLFTDNEFCLELLYENWSNLKEYYLAPMDIKNLSLNNKFFLVQSAKSCGLKVPETYRDIAAVTSYPVIVKPLNGLAHRNRLIKKAYQCNNPGELSKTLSILHLHGAQAIIQQIIPGDTQDLYCVTLYRNAQGNIFIGSVTRKLREHPSQYGTGTAHLFCSQPDLVEKSITLLNALDYNGIAEIEYKYNKETNDYYIIEVNGRFPLETSIVHKLGNQFIYRIYLDLIGTPLQGEFTEGSKQKPVLWSFFLKDFLVARSKLSLISDYFTYVRSSSIQWAIWDRNDIKPIIFYYIYLLHELVHTAVHWG